MSYLNEQGQELLFDQLDNIQHSYSIMMDSYQRNITEITSKCLSEVIIYDILFSEIEEQLSAFSQLSRFCKGERASELPVSKASTTHSRFSSVFVFHFHFSIN